MNQIDLNHDEQVFYNRIVWDLGEFNARVTEEQEDILNSAEELLKLLRNRRAIPQIRLDLFSRPDLNLAGRGKSPMQLLEKNGVTIRNPAFFKYLWYFIHGPNLPTATIERIEQIMQTQAGATSDLVSHLTSIIRDQVKEHHLGSSAATEFEKLAHEIGLGRYAEDFRKAALTPPR